MASTQEDVLAEDLSDLNLKEIHTKEHQGPSRGKKPAAKRGPRPPDTPPVQLSKALSYILRHGAAKEGLPLRADGYVLLDQVLGRPRVSKISMSGGQEGKGDKPAENAPSKDDVLSIVKADSKGRFETKEDEEHRIWIRAVQGHSIKDVTALDHVDLTLDNLHILESKDAAPLPRGTLPDGIEILHGTTRDAWGKIETSGGLSRMKRNHIHLAKGRPGAAGVISGMRNSSPLIIHIDLIKALQDGIAFHLASNGAVLTKGKGDTGVLPLTYIRNVEESKSNNVIWQRLEQ